jgi:periplasmic protein TonB
VFDEVTKQEGGKRAARRGAYLMGSTVLQVFLVLALIAVSARIGAKVVEDKAVDVKFIRQAPPPPPPPPPPPAKRPQSKPKTDTPRKVMPPMAMIQPKDVPAELKPPDPSKKEEEEAGSDEGVEGGVVGGVVGGQVRGGIEDAPAYATAGYRKPEQAVKNCVQNAVRVPKELVGFVSGPITVKFAIRKDGSPSSFQVMTQIPDRRIGDLIWQAVASCQWVPGTDPQGRPTSIWVIMPIRFLGG